ncbi:hypothetical protein [Streptomyces sp. NPDC050988]|uniref:hypothetical protein n=1 Tax=Streptomyces sp. NPDC050988 TaxID=3365637 RepID=UPI0037BC40C3
MNFVKRAGFSLWSRRGRTLITLCTFLVISVMVLAGVLIQDATAQAKNEAKRSVGAEVNLGMDVTGQNAAGGMVAPQISAATVEKLGASKLVQKYNYSMFDRGVVKGGTELVTGGVDTKPPAWVPTAPRPSESSTPRSCPTSAAGSSNSCPEHISPPPTRTSTCC